MHKSCTSYTTSNKTVCKIHLFGKMWHVKWLSKIPTYMIKKHFLSCFHFPYKSIPKLVIFQWRTDCGWLHSFHLTPGNIFAYFSLDSKTLEGTWKMELLGKSLSVIIQTLIYKPYMYYKGHKSKETLSGKVSRSFPYHSLLNFHLWISYDSNIIISFLYNMAIKHLSLKNWKI